MLQSLSTYVSTWCPCLHNGHCCTVIISVCPGTCHISYSNNSQQFFSFPLLSFCAITIKKKHKLIQPWHYKETGRRYRNILSWQIVIEKWWIFKILISCIFVNKVLGAVMATDAYTLYDAIKERFTEESNLDEFVARFVVEM